MSGRDLPRRASTRALGVNVIASAVAALSLISCDRALAQRVPARAANQVLLTDANFAQFTNATDNLSAYFKRHPEIKPNSNDDSYSSADEAAKALCEPHPEVRVAIAATGLTCSQYVAITMSLETAAAFATMQASGQRATTADPNANANVLFYRKHEAAVKRVLAQMGAGEGAES